MSIKEPVSHYDVNGLSPLDVFKALNDDGTTPIESFYRFNIIKYIWRYPRKNGIDDLKKAKNYLEFLIDELDKPK